MVKALERTLEHLDSIALDVALIGDTPRAPENPPVCLSSNLDDALSCATARDTAIATDYLAEQANVAREAGVTFLLAEQNTNVALRYARYGYILENGRVVLDGDASALRDNEDVKEFYLGLSTSGRRSFRDIKSYKRRKRWL